MGNCVVLARYRYRKMEEAPPEAMALDELPLRRVGAVTALLDRDGNPSAATPPFLVNLYTRSFMFFFTYLDHAVNNCCCIFLVSLYVLLLFAVNVYRATRVFMSLFFEQFCGRINPLWHVMVPEDYWSWFSYASNLLRSVVSLEVLDRTCFAEVRRYRLNGPCLNDVLNLSTNQFLDRHL